MVFGLLIALALSPYLKISALVPTQLAMASSAFRMVASTAVLGLAVGVVGLITCISFGVWQLKWSVVWVCVATAPLYGGLAGLGAVFSNGSSAR
jgi:hypothetical protein